MNMLARLLHHWLHDCGVLLLYTRVWDLRSFKDPSDRFTGHKCESAIAKTITIFMTIYDNFFQPFLKDN